MESNSTRLISETDSTAVDVDADDGVPVLREEENDEAGLADIPLANPVRRSKRQRTRPDQEQASIISDEDETGSAIEIDSDTEAPPSKRRRDGMGFDNEDQGRDDDKKKLAMDVSYEGFAIYGRVLCLVVKKRETGKSRQPANSATAAASSASTGNRPEGQAMMENWITSTQIPVGEEVL